MIPLQPILIVVLICCVTLYFRRFRSRFVDRAIVASLFATATLFVMYPSLANRLAAVAGVSRGADLFFYLTIPSLGFVDLLLLARVQDLRYKLTALARELTLLQDEIGTNAAYNQQSPLVRKV